MVSEKLHNHEALALAIIDVGSVVTLGFPDGTEIIRIIDRNETITDGAATIDSPLGREIRRKKAGDIITFSIPSGEELSVEIIDVDNSSLGL